MKFKKVAATIAAFVLVAGSVSVASPAQAGNGLVPILKPAPVVAANAGTPPTPTKSDKAYKATSKDKTNLKGNPTGFSTFACPCFNYVIARQVLPAGTTGDGLAANLPVENTFLKQTTPKDNHVLAQLSVQSADSLQAIEFGVTIDPALFGNTAPHIFAGYRKGGAWAGYGVGFVDYAPNTAYTYGSTLPVTAGVQKRFEIKQSSGVWWLAYDGQWIGYIPNSVFTAAPSVTFINGGLFQAFMEEVGPNTQSCSDLGNGLPASDGNASRLGSIQVTGTVPATATVMTASIQPGTAIGYTATSLSTTTVRGGGPGANAALTAVGTTGSC